MAKRPKERYSHIICIFYWTNLLCTKLPYCLLYNRELFECPPVLSFPGNDSSKRLCQTQQVIIIILLPGTCDPISNSPSGLQICSSQCQFGKRTFTFSQTFSALFQAFLLMLSPFLDFWRITRKFQRESKILYPTGIHFIKYFDMVQITRFF